ncbi:hypothetical protein ERC79_07345 [Rhodococcus sp. ABRD24]|uniref:hypothetical protein n=1 Tax=Rhodococcus sp. ABRD24 TaxID=2507582 RepID=UPI00103B8712|nr:hypothetical protein [Rhodococcus sp. ABRD24]QBJ95800.1 hypothetical protein ERC79_07345 [Rhodococcus sp. ABRD24]
MSVSVARRSAAGVAVSAAAVGLVLVSAGPATAHNTTTNFNNACVARTGTFIGNIHQPSQAASVSVDHPGSTPGAYIIKPGPQTVPTSASGGTVVNLSRIAVVFKIDPATYVSSSVVPGSSTNVSGTPQLTRVDINLNEDPAGSYLALHGGATIRDAVEKIPAIDANSPDAGLTALAGTTFTLPSVEVVTTAPAGVNPPVYAKTDGNSGLYGSTKNYLTFLSKATHPLLPGPQYVPTMCMPSDMPVPPRGNSDLNTAIPLNGGAGNLH